MTGFARVSRTTGPGELTVSIKTVNHKGLDMHFHLPPEFDGVEPALRTALRKRLARGHVQVQVLFKRSSEAAGVPVINEEALRTWLNAFREAAGKFGLNSEPDLNQALRMPGMFEHRGAAEGGVDAQQSIEGEVLAAAAEALAALDEFRTREGLALEAELRSRTQALRTLVRQMEEIRHRALPYFQQRLRDRLGELLGSIQIEPSRLVQEAAILADRSDVSEELVRLRTHVEQTDEMLAGQGECGKKLDFLLQEMNREANTILSKTSGLGEPGLKMTDLALAARAEIDRIREQSLNIE